MRDTVVAGLTCLALLVPGVAGAQMTDQRMAFAASQAKDLEFPAAPSAFGRTPAMAIHKPEGPGPFPALVLFHQCGGLGSPFKWQNLSMLQWAKEAVARGYVAFIVDGFGQRNVDSTCYGPKNGVNLVRNVKDALQAAEHLRKLDFVDGKRIALAGYSHGAMIGLAAASARWNRVLGGGEGFRAVVSFYPGCFSLKPPAGTAYELIDPDIDRPLLVLMAEKDNETPPQECIEKLAPPKAAGAPIEWHIYPGLTHCWDCENLHGVRKVDARGNHIVYYYDKAATRDSAERMFAFIEKAFVRPR